MGGMRKIRREQRRARPAGLFSLTTWMAAFLAVLAGVPAAAQLLPAADAQQFRRAIEAVQAQRLGSAEQLLSDLAQKYPKHPDVHEALAGVLDLLGRIEEATRHFEIAAKGKPFSADLRMNLAINYARQNRAQEAEHEFQAVLRLRPSDATAHFNLGTLLLRQQQFDRALPHLEQARRLQPTDFANGYQLALCNFLLRRHDEAQRFLDQLSQRGAARPEYQLLRGLNLKVLGHEAEAGASLARGLAAMPAVPEALPTVAPLFFHVDLAAEVLPWIERVARQNLESLQAITYLARAQLTAGQLQPARATLTLALAKWPSAELHHLLGEVEERMGNYVSAAQHLQRAAELNPSEAYLYDLGYEFLAHWNWDAALSVFGRAAERYPQSARIRLGAATAHYGKGYYNDALDSLLDAALLEPRNELTHRMLAAILPVSTGKAGQVLPWLRAYASAEPKKAIANYAYGVGLWQNPDRPATRAELAEAVQLLTRAAELGPDVAEIHYHLGLLLSEQQQWPRAVTALETAARVKPDYPEANYRLALAYQRLGRSEEARSTMARYARLKEEQDAKLDERTAKTATFLFALKP